MENTVLKVTNLTKSFPGKWSWQKFTNDPPATAVKGITFSVHPGEIVGLLGPNGAGKTTTIQMLLGTTTPTSGEISYFSKDFTTHRSQILEQINYASAYTKFPWHLTVKENLMVYALMYNVPNPTKRIQKLLEQFDMHKYINSPMRDLSAGQTTRVILAKAFINYPKLILLDEPTASLDPDSAANVRQFLLRQQQEYQVAMLFTSHNMVEVTEVCDQVLFLQHGKIVAKNTPDGLAREIDEVKINLRLVDGSETVVRCKESEISHQLQHLSKQGIHYTQISIDKPTLEDYFIQKAKEK